MYFLFFIAQSCNKSRIKRETQRSFLERFDVKSDKIACKGTPRQRNNTKYSQLCLQTLGNKAYKILRL